MFFARSSVFQPETCRECLGGRCQDRGWLIVLICHPQTEFTRCTHSDPRMQSAVLNYILSISLIFLTPFIKTACRVGTHGTSLFREVHRCTLARRGPVHLPEVSSAPGGWGMVRTVTCHDVHSVPGTVGARPIGLFSE